VVTYSLADSRFLIEDVAGSFSSLFLFKTTHFFIVPRNLAARALDIALGALASAQTYLNELQSARPRDEAASAVAEHKVAVAEHKVAVAKHDVAVAEHKVAVAKHGESSQQHIEATAAVYQAAVGMWEAKMATFVVNSSEYDEAKEQKEFAKGELRKVQTVLAAGEIIFSFSFSFSFLFYFIHFLSFPFLSFPFLPFLTFCFSSFSFFLSFFLSSFKHTHLFVRLNGGFKYSRGDSQLSTTCNILLLKFIFRFFFFSSDTWSSRCATTTTAAGFIN
jgi:hypothetical protein